MGQGALPQKTGEHTGEYTRATQKMQANRGAGSGR
jgi:hypothetical protein